MSLRWNGERPLPLISPASICSSYGGNNTYTTWISRKNAAADSAPYGVLHGETELALCDAGSSKQAQGMT